MYLCIFSKHCYTVHCHLIITRLMMNDLVVLYMHCFTVFSTWIWKLFFFKLFRLCLFHIFDIIVWRPQLQICFRTWHFRPSQDQDFNITIYSWLLFYSNWHHRWFRWINSLPSFNIFVGVNGRCTCRKLLIISYQVVGIKTGM